MLFYCILFAFIVATKGSWREDIVDYDSLKRQIPFLPAFYTFGKVPSGQTEEDPICSSQAIRRCAIKKAILQARIATAGDEEYSESDENPKQPCRLLAYETRCLREAGCVSPSSFLALGLTPRKASIAELKLKINEILCPNADNNEDYRDLSQTFVLLNNELSKCALQFDIAYESELPLRQAYTILEKYTDCVETIFNDNFESTSLMSATKLLEAIVGQLNLPKNLEMLRSKGLLSKAPFSFFSQSLQEESDCGDLQCDVDTYKKCTDQAKQELHLQPKCVYELMKGLMTIIEKERKKGYEHICSAYGQMKECGGAKMRDCFNTKVLERKMKLSKESAILLNLTIFSIDYHCSHQVFDDSFDCLYDTQKAKAAVLKKCEKRFREDIKKEGMPCKAGQHFLDCTSSPFKRACGVKAAQGVCGYEMSLLHQYGPHMRRCPMHCNL